MQFNKVISEMYNPIMGFIESIIHVYCLVLKFGEGIRHLLQMILGIMVIYQN